MANIFEVEVEDISALDPIKLTKLLKKLLLSEAQSNGIPARSVEVALNINVPDGGEDGRIKWEDGPNNTNFLPSRFVQFQNKSTNDFGPAACANEIVDSKGSIKSMVDKALSKGGAYILFTTTQFNQAQKEKGINAIREKLRCLKKSYAEPAVIDIYGASRIQDWVNKYPPVVTTVLNWRGKSLPIGLQTFDEWANYSDLQKFEYIEDDKRKEQQIEMRNLLAQERKCGRIVGLSGLGKSRMALELCRDHQNDGFSNMVLYFNAAFEGKSLPKYFKSWVKEELRIILIIDNCDLELHTALKQEVEHLDSKLSMLTIDNNPVEKSETRTIELERLEDSQIKQMLEQEYGKKLPDLDRVVSFAQGFSQIAKLLADARLDQDENIGNLNDDHLFKKLLWKDNQEDKDELRILKHCALFDKFGLDDTASEEIQFIAEFFELNIDRLYECINKFESRKIIDRRGRYAQIIPKPLAIRLASDWWKNTRPDKQTDLIHAIMPGQLQNSFCEQVAKLDFHPEVKQFTENLCGESAPFGQAEVILSDKGSRLFCSLVEVNPQATSSALYRILSELTSEEHKIIAGDVRRNLVRALEKLCFHETAFDRSAKCLLWLAAAENEVWGNNATGLFKQLFRVFLSGTEATPEQRLEIIDYTLKSQDKTVRRLAVTALESAISNGHEVRAVGAEFQGSSRSLEEWGPTIWQEAFDYWVACIERLTSIILENSTESESAKGALAFGIYELIETGEPVASALDQAINKIVSAQGPFWPQALENIQIARSVYSKNSPDKAVEFLDQWIRLLTPVAIEDRIKLIVSIPPYQQEKDESDQYVDIAKINAENLAEELSNDIEQVIPYIDQLSSGEQRQGWTFGQGLVIHSRRWEPLLTETISVVSSIEQPNLAFLSGILNGINDLDNKEWEVCIEKLYYDKQLGKFYPEIIRTGNIQTKHLNNLINLINLGRAEEISVVILSYGRVIHHLDPMHVIDFVKQLRIISAKAAWISLDILYTYCFGDEEKWKACEKTFSELLSELSLNPKHRMRNLEMHHWKEAARKLLNKKNPEFAMGLTKQILLSRTASNNFGDLSNYIKPILRLLLKQHSEHVWPLISNVVKEADSITEWRLSRLFSKESIFDNRQTSVLADLPEDVLHKWCRAEPYNAPHFMARATEIFVENEGEFKISKRAQFLIDEFGNNYKILDALSVNIGSFGVSGSIVQNFQKRVSALNPLRKHKFPEVRNWAERIIENLNKKINQELKRDEERAWGIY